MIRIFKKISGCCRHAVHGVGDDGDDTEENSFPTGVTANPQKAKPPTVAMAFCVYINPLQEYLLID